MGKICGIRNAKIYFLNKFRENIQEFQQNVRNHEISTVDLLPDFIHLFQRSAEDMKCRKHIDNEMNDENQPDGGIEIVNRFKEINIYF